MTFNGPVTADYIGSNQIAVDQLLANSLSIPGAIDVGVPGTIVRSPLTVTSSLTVQGTGRFSSDLAVQGRGSFTGGVRGHGTSTFDNLSAGNASASSLALNGPLTFGTLGTAPVPRNAWMGNWSPYTSWYRLGTWTAPQNGKVLKLNVVGCGNGYNVNNHGNQKGVPSIFELDILFHTSNGVDFVDQGCFANGWARSHHVLWPPQGVSVQYTPNDLSDGAEYVFWINLGAFAGEVMVTATSRYPFVANFAGPRTFLPPSYRIGLYIASVMNSMSATSAYLTYWQNL